MIKTNLRTTDGLAVYDLDPLASDLWVVAGPDGHTEQIDTDNLPDGFRWVTNEEWASLQDDPPRVEVCTCVEWVRENDFDKDGIEERDWDEATNTYIAAVMTGLRDKGCEVVSAKGQRKFYHGWNGAHFVDRCGCVASWTQLTDEQKKIITEVRIAAQKQTTEVWKTDKNQYQFCTDSESGKLAAETYQDACEQLRDMVGNDPEESGAWGWVEDHDGARMKIGYIP